MATISYCLNNVDARTRQALRTCALSTVEDMCLQRCGECYAGPFLVSDGQSVTGATHAAILEQIIKSIKSDQPMTNQGSE